MLPLPGAPSKLDDQLESDMESYYAEHIDPGVGIPRPFWCQKLALNRDECHGLALSMTGDGTTPAFKFLYATQSPSYDIMFLKMIPAPTFCVIEGPGRGAKLDLRQPHWRWQFSYDDVELLRECDLPFGSDPAEMWILPGLHSAGRFFATDLDYERFDEYTSRFAWVDHP